MRISVASLRRDGVRVCRFTGRRGMCGSCANFCTALQCAAGRAGVTRHNLQIPRGRGLAKLARVPRPGAAAGVPAPHSAACNCRVRAAPRSRHSQGSVAARSCAILRTHRPAPRTLMRWVTWILRPSSGYHGAASGVTAVPLQYLEPGAELWPQQ